MTISLPTRSPIMTSSELVELERLSNKLLLIKHAIGGFFPGFSGSLQDMQEVLEIGCGPGSWSLALAQRYSHMHITAIDTNSLMIAHANKQAQDCRQDIQYLQTPNLRQFLFAENAFDGISIQLLSKVLVQDAWPALFHECWRMLRPGGWIRVTDFEPVLSNGSVHQELWNLLMRAMGRSPYEHSFKRIELLLASCGFQLPICLNHSIDYSYGQALYHEWKNDFLILLHSILPTLVEMSMIHQDQIEQLYQQQKIEISTVHFRAILPMKTIWGQKQGKSDMIGF